ncbi:MAG: DUF523 domain-containing protein [Arenicellales bacterium]
MISKILISACLLGDQVRYDGKGKLLSHPLLQTWLAEQRLIKLCPEIAGGLATPRAAAEIQHADHSQHRVITSTGEDVSIAFKRGAEQALALAQQHNIKFALLKANSPSCGNQQIYNGHFTGELIPGMGITASLLQQHGIRVFNEHQLETLALALKNQ